MTEIKFGGGGGGSSSGGSGGGGGLDINGLLDELEQAEERLRNNPGLRRMLGVDDGMDIMGNSNDSGGDSGIDQQEVPTKDSLDASFLEDLLEAMCEEGYGDFTLNQLHSFVANNPQQVNAMIKRQQ